MRETVRSRKEECTGCGACVSVCPKKAITMKQDEEGFRYPSVDQSLCISCDLCEKRCPVGKPKPENRPKVFGAFNRNEQIRRASSSGGIFTALAHDMIGRGGVVFGAVFDEALHVEHVGAFDETELAGMRGSKYVQSDCAEAIEHAVSLLERGIPVLFSGTPCQIDGLLARVGKTNRELLLTVDFTCHGVASPGVFASYLRGLERDNGKRVTAYSFRDKRHGWKDFSAVATFEDGTEHAGSQTTEPFLYGFLQNLYLRPSCANCHDLRDTHHAADLTISDLWGAETACSQADDDRGLSLVSANTQAGRRAIERVLKELTVFPVKTDGLQRANPSLKEAAQNHPKRSAFFRHFARQGFDSKRVMKLLRGPGRAERIARRIAHLPVGAMRRIRVLLGR